LVRKIPYKDIKYFSKLFLDYLDRDDSLRLFANYFPTLDNFEKQIAEKKNNQINRSVLVKVLKDQNQSFNLSKLSKKNINLLKSENTFSVTTGHQICLFTGPLYFIYKIISTINLCEQLSVKYNNNNFIPIFWMASEDHDFQEVNHIYLFGEKIEWKNKQNGAVGKMNLCGFEEVISKLKITLGSHKNADRLISLFEQSYLNHKNLSDATRFLVNELFAKYGLVIIDGDDKDLKKQFIPQIKKDILQNGFVDNIRQCSNNLAKNYKSQAFVRDINFFKLSKGNRQLIVKNTCEREIDEHPERFSPNVLLRPLYQEVILPNVAYVGGEAEVAYWMQLKTAFKQEAIPFPILVLRNSALLVNSKQQYVFQKLGFELEDIFLSEHELTKRYVLASSNSEISLLNEKIALDLLFQKIISKTSDLSLQNSIRAQLQKQLSSLDNIQEKLVRIEKKKKMNLL
jgi:bacillithiol biosynthesis cysteine-adding enzyme BshC